MRTAIAVVLALSLGGCTGFIDRLDVFSHSQLHNEYATKLLTELLPDDEWKHIYPDSETRRDASAILFGYGEEGGQLLSLQRHLDFPRMGTINVDIADAASIRLRHKIMIGTDLASWTLIRKETTWPEENPFKRIYLFKRPEGQGHSLRGLIFLDGAIVEISYPGPVTAQTTDEIEALTWRTAERLEEIYEKDLKSISEGPLFKDNPVLTRPDLSDPDTNSAHNMEN